MHPKVWILVREEDVHFFYVAAGNRQEFRAGRQVWKTSSMAWVGIMSHYDSSLHPRHWPANRDVEEEGFFNLSLASGFWSRKRQKLYRIPRIQLVNP